MGTRFFVYVEKKYYLCISFDESDKMSGQYSSRLLERAVDEVSKLPSIGRKTAMRLVLHLLRQDVGKTDVLCDALSELVHGVKYCNVCHSISDDDVCTICADESRDARLVCVVENVQDVMAVEATQQYRGLYHVLGGVISPMDGIGPSQLEIESLVERVAAGGVDEVILALSSTMEGDATNFYIFRRLAMYEGVKLTVLARGMSINDELQYTDELTLGRSLVNRVPFTGK